MSFIYGKYAVSELLRLKPEAADTLFYSQINPFLHVPNLFKQKLTSLQIRQKFNLQEFENPQGLVLTLKKDLNRLLCTDLQVLLIEASYGQTETTSDLKNKDSSPANFLLWLPAIQDGHNLGAIIRSAVALGGISGIILPEHKAIKLNATVAKVSAGSIFSLQYAYFRDYTKTAQLLKENGFNLLCLHKQTQAISIQHFDFASKQPYVLVLGDEHKGIPWQIQKQADAHLQIEQTGAVDSLNLSVSAGITFYEINKQINSCLNNI